MTPPNRPRHAGRLKAFKVRGGTVAEMIAGAGRVDGLDAADLDYPDHFEAHDTAALPGLLAAQGFAFNGLAMRDYIDPGLRRGAFTHPDPAVRRAAIELTKRGIDAGLAMGGG